MRNRQAWILIVAVCALAATGCNGAGESGASGEQAKAWTEIMPGLGYVDSTIGQGAEVKSDDFIVAHYAGYLWVDGQKGTKFDSSFDRGEPIAFPLGRSFVITGWERGVPGMHVGGKRSLLIEPDLAYGAEGRPPTIPANSTLMFDIEIVDVPNVAVEITEQGTGPVAEVGDNVSVHYTGWLWENGEPTTEFDSSRGRGVPFKFTLGAGQVIPGWDKGVEGLAVGTKARLVIPSVMGYGKQGAPPTIPGDADLVFDVELVEIADK